MLNYLVEFVGTFVFLSVILRVGEPIPIAVALLASIYFGGSISGGHFNPAVSVMMAMAGKMNMKDLAPYVIAQIAGGLAALELYKRVKF